MKNKMLNAIITKPVLSTYALIPTNIIETMLIRYLSPVLLVVMADTADNTANLEWPIPWYHHHHPLPSLHDTVQLGWWASLVKRVSDHDTSRESRHGSQ